MNNLFEQMVLSLNSLIVCDIVFSLWLTSGYKISERNRLTDKFVSVPKKLSSAVTPWSADQGEEVDLLTAFNDDHGGVIIDMKSPMSSKDFISSLRASILNWRQQVIILTAGFLAQILFPGRMTICYYLQTHLVITVIRTN